MPPLGRAEIRLFAVVPAFKGQEAATPILGGNYLSNKWELFIYYTLVIRLIIPVVLFKLNFFMMFVYIYLLQDILQNLY